MPAARPETLIMREAREMARDDRLRVTVRIGDMTVTVEPVDGGGVAGVASPTGGDAWDAWAARKGKR